MEEVENQTASIFGRDLYHFLVDYTEKYEQGYRLSEDPYHFPTAYIGFYQATLKKPYVAPVKEPKPVSPEVAEFRERFADQEGAALPQVSKRGPKPKQQGE